MTLYWLFLPVWALGICNLDRIGAWLTAPLREWLDES